MDILLRIAIVLGLIGINAFFVMVEFAIVSVRRSRIAQLVATGDPDAARVAGLQAQLEILLSTTQFGITISSLALGWIGERAIAQLVATVLAQIASAGGDVPLWQDTLSHALAIPIAFGILAYGQIVIGGLVPKSIAIAHADTVARLLAPPSQTIARIFKPLLWIFDISTRSILRFLKIDANTIRTNSSISREEIQHLVTTLPITDDMSANMRRLLNSAFSLADIRLERIAIPRREMVTLPAHATVKQLAATVARTGHTRYPVIESTHLRDRTSTEPTIVGTIYFPDLATAIAEGSLSPDAPISPWIVSPAEFFPKTNTLDRVLQQMRGSQIEMAIVVDEFDSTIGLITLRDLLAEIVAIEAAVREELQIEKIDDDRYVIQGQTSINTLNQTIPDLKLYSIYPETSTIAGCCLDYFKKFPQLNDSFIFRNWQFKIVRIERGRIDKIELTRMS
jgi:CBS domain containing-hemolysin-like protein